MTDIHRHMNVLRSNLLPNDKNGFLTCKAITVYDDLAKSQVRMSELNSIGKEANLML